MSRLLDIEGALARSRQPEKAETAAPTQGETILDIEGALNRSRAADLTGAPQPAPSSLPLEPEPTDNLTRLFAESAKAFARESLRTAENIGGAGVEMGGAGVARLGQFFRDVGREDTGLPDIENPLADHRAYAKDVFDSDRASLTPDESLQDVTYTGGLGELFTGKGESGGRGQASADLATKLISDMAGITPSVAATVVGFVLGGPAGAGIAGGGLEGLGQYEQAKAGGASDGEAARQAAVVAPGTMVLNALPFLKAIDNFIPEKLKSRATRVILTGLTEGGTETAEGALGPLAEASVPTNATETWELLERMGQGVIDESAVFPAAALMGGGAASVAKEAKQPKTNTDAVAEAAEDDLPDAMAQSDSQPVSFQPEPAETQERILSPRLEAAIRARYPDGVPEQADQPEPNVLSGVEPEPADRSTLPVVDDSLIPRPKAQQGVDLGAKQPDVVDAAPEPVGVPTSGVQAEPDTAPEKQPWEMSREEYDRSRAESIGMGFEIDDNLPGLGRYSPSRKTISRRSRTEISGVTTHEIRHAIDENLGIHKDLFEPGKKFRREFISKEMQSLLDQKKESGARTQQDYQRKRHPRERTEAIIDLALQGDSDLAAQFPEIVAEMDRRGLGDLARLNVSHRAQIEAALERGEAVPDVVIDEYPQLRSDPRFPSIRRVSPMPEEDPVDDSDVSDLQPLTDQRTTALESAAQTLDAMETQQPTGEITGADILTGQREVGAGIEPESTTSFDPAQVPAVEVPVSEVDLSKEVPNFKEGADVKTGVVDPLEGGYNRLGTAPIVVWERSDGRKEVVTGRHRLDLARRSGENTIPAQLVREKDGFSLDMARTFDAEANIRDGQGTTRDYATYFRETGLDLPEAQARGLVSRAKGQNGWALGQDASNDLYTLYRNREIGEAQAVAIAKAAPGNEFAQRVGMRRASEENRVHPQELANAVQSAAVMGADIQQGGGEADLFGMLDDTAWIEETKRRGAIATERQRSIAEQLRILNAAKVDPSKARDLGINISIDDPAGIQTERSRLKVEQERWKEWSQHPDLVQEVIGAESERGVQEGLFGEGAASQQQGTPVTEDDARAIFTEAGDIGAQLAENLAVVDDIGYMTANEAMQYQGRNESIYQAGVAARESGETMTTVRKVADVNLGSGQVRLYKGASRESVVEELVHWAGKAENGFLSKNERRVLERKFGTSDLTSETVAAAVVEYEKSRRAPSPSIRRIFNKVVEMVKRVGAKAFGDKALTAEEVYRRILSGQTDGGFAPPSGADGSRAARDSKSRLTPHQQRMVRTPEFQRWFEGSETVDESGEPLRLFHGTPRAGFNEFREGAHFTTNPDYASIYTNPSASSMGGPARRSDAPAVYPAFVAMKRPFDTREPEHAALYEEFTSSFGNGTPLSERGLPDWTDSLNILEWFDETNQQFDGVLLDEGSTEDGGWRGISYVPRTSAQVKSATGNSGGFDSSNPDIRAAADEPYGRPDLANPATDPAARRAMDAIDEDRNRTGDPAVKSDGDTLLEARRWLQYVGRDGALARLGEAADSGVLDDSSKALNDFETVAVRALVDDALAEAVTTQDQTKIEEAFEIAEQWRRSGTEAARAFRQRYDRVMTPAQRAEHAITQALYSGNAKLEEQVVRLRARLRSGEITPLQRKRAEHQQKQLQQQMAQELQRIQMALAKKGWNLADLENISEDPRKSSSLLRDIAGEQATYWDKQYEWWINSILSGLPTHAAITVSQSANTLWEYTGRRLSEATLNLVARDADAATLGEMNEIWRVLFSTQSHARAFRSALSAWGFERPVWQDEITGGRDDRGSKLEYTSTAIKGKKGRIIRMPGRAINFQDSYFSSMAAQAEMVALAYRQAKQEELTGADARQRARELADDLSSAAWEPKTVSEQEMGESIRGRAIQKGKQLAFTEEVEDVAGEKIGQAVSAMRRVPGMRYIVPFYRAPIGIAAGGMKLSPLSAVNSVQKTVRYAAGNESITRADLVRTWSETAMAMGILSFFAGALGDEEDEPWLTGSSPWRSTKKGERELNYRVAPPQSVRIGDTWYSYSRMEPFATGLTQMLDAIELTKEAKNGAEAERLMGDTYQRFVSSMLVDKTFMSGLSDLIEAASSGEALKRLSLNLGAGFVPNLVRSAGRGVEDAIKETAAADGVKQIQYKAFPGITQLPNRVDLWGRDVTKARGMSPVTDTLYRLTAPGHAFPAPIDEASKIDLMMKRWNLQNPNDVWAPERPQPYITHNGKRLDMTPGQYEEFSRIAGEHALKVASGKSYNYEQPTDRDRKRVQSALDAGRRVARRQMLAELIRSSREDGKV